MSNNILQWNPSKNNQQDDATYTTDPMRTGGAVPGIFDKELANKLFYQLSTLCSALGEMLSNKGYSVSDSNILTLVSTLSNILTKADFGSTSGTVCEGDDSRLYESHSFSTDIAYQIFSSGLILQCGTQSSDSNGTQFATFPMEFPNGVFEVIASSMQTSSTIPCIVVVNSWTKKGFTWSGFYGSSLTKASTNNVRCSYFAMGY